MIETINMKSITVAVVDNDTVIESTQDFLDIMATTYYNEDAENIGIVVDKNTLMDDFFDLKTGIAGEILQKFSNYKVRLIIYGNFDEYKSKSLNDFIRECNRGNLIFFIESLDLALEKCKSL